MIFHAETLFGGIFRNHETAQAVIRAAGIGLHHQHAVVVLAAGSTNRIYEGLVVAILHFLVLLGGVRPVDGCLVGSRKCQLAAVVAEIGGYISPQGCQLLVVLLLFVVSGMAVVPFLVVIINHDEHILVETPVHDLLHALQPRLVDGHRRSVRQMVCPTDRDTDAVEAGFPDGMDHLLRRLGIAPAGLRSRAFE